MAGKSTIKAVHVSPFRIFRIFAGCGITKNNTPKGSLVEFLSLITYFIYLWVGEPLQVAQMYADMLLPESQIFGQMTSLKQDLGSCSAKHQT